MQETIINYIIQEIHGGVQAVEISVEENLLESGLVESMSMMRLIQFIEDTYEFRVAPQEMIIENFMTVEAIVKYVKKKKE